MQDIRCKGCNKILAKATVMVAAIKCPRCYMIFEYHVYSNTLYVTNSVDPQEMLLQKHERRVTNNTESIETADP